MTYSAFLGGEVCDPSPTLLTGLFSVGTWCATTQTYYSKTRVCEMPGSPVESFLSPNESLIK